MRGARSRRPPTRPATRPRPIPEISDDEIRETIEANQLKLIKERGADFTIFIPARQRDGAACRRPGSGKRMGDALQRPDLPRDAAVPRHLHRRVHAAAEPEGGHAKASIAELRRCVEELGFVVCNLNPDPGGGHFEHPPLTDEYWFPIYEAMCELDVPAMIHVSGSCNPAMHATGGYLPRGRHRRLHAAAAGRPVHAASRSCADHSARRRRGALSLGPLPRAWPTCSSSPSLDEYI